MVNPTGQRTSPADGPLRVGVIGLGPLWEQRYRPALRALSGLLQPVVLCDQIEQLAVREAKRLGCAWAGLTELLEREDVDAVLLLDAQWYGLWPLPGARAGKPVFCCGTFAVDDEYADGLSQQVGGGLPVLFEMASAAAPALPRLRELLATCLGPARVVLCELVEPERPGYPMAAGPGAEAALIHCCGALLAGEPRGVLASGPAEGSCRSLLLEFGEDRMIQISCCRAPVARSSVRLHVLAERGTARATFPGRVSWTDAAGRHTDVLPRERPLGQVLLERFYRVAREGQPPAPGLDEAYRLLTWGRAAERSRREGRRVELAELKSDH